MKHKRSLFKNRSLRFKLFACILLFIILPLLLLALFTNFFISTLLKDRAYEVPYNNLRNTTGELTSLLDRAEYFALEMLGNNEVQKLISERRAFSEAVEIFSIEKTVITEQKKLEFSFYNVLQDTANVMYVGRKLDVDFTPWYIQALAYDGQGFWAFNQARIVTSNQEASLLSYFQKIKDLNGFVPTNIVQVISFTESRIREIYSGVNQFKGARTLLLDGEGRVLSASVGALVGTLLEAGHPLLEDPPSAGFRETQYQGEQWVLFVCAAGRDGWRLTQMVPTASIFTFQQSLMILLLSAIALCLLFGVLYSYIQNKHILKPFYDLKARMDRLLVGDYSLSYLPDSRDEIAMVSNSVVVVSEQMREAVRHRYQERLRLQEAEFLALEAQINPHFLYNTLDSIYWISLRTKDHQVGEQISALAEYYKGVLSKGRSMVSIGEELEIVRNYFVLQQSKYGDRIKLSVSMDEGLEEVLIPKLILQPLVENAVLHGLECKIEGGRVSIYIRDCGEDLEITVADDGVGFDGEDILRCLSEKKCDRAYALRNIDARLRLKYGEAYRLRLQSELGVGSIVMVRVAMQAPPTDETDLWEENA